jgi:single-strand DNA-binding protein
MNEIVAALLRSSAWTIPGHLGGDPEIRFLNSGTAVCNFNLAVNKPGAKKGDGQEPDWFKIEIWGDQAQVAADTLRKGSLCIVTGRARTESWTSRDGQARVSTVIRAEKWATEWATPEATPSPAAASAPAATARPAAPATVFQSNGGAGFDDSEVPF